MILSCNSCDKKFVVPDNAISASGRLVQCSACGNKWKQYPSKIENEVKNKIDNIKPVVKKIVKSAKIRKQRTNKKTGPSLYSPEYLAKKHGIKINEKSKILQKKLNDKTEVSFGFYNFLVISIIILTFTLRSLYFAENLIVEYLPSLKIYIDYLFENIKNIQEIIKSFFSNY